MALLSPSWGLLGALALVCVLSLSGVAVQTARVSAGQASLKAVQADLEDTRNALEALHEANARRTATNIKQSTARAASAKSLADTRDALRKEAANAPEPKPVLSSAQLDRMQRLTDAANASIRAASELPGASVGTPASKR